jgi:hypothetical protein
MPADGTNRSAGFLVDSGTDPRVHCGCCECQVQVPSFRVHLYRGLVWDEQFIGGIWQIRDEPAEE